MINEPISRDQVERSLCKAKLKRTARFGGIPAEVLRNPVCMDCITLTFALRMERFQVSGILEQVSFSRSQDNHRNLLNYRGICLISIHAKSMQTN